MLFGAGALAGLVMVEVLLWVVIVTPMWKVLPVVPPFVMRGVASPDALTASEHFAGNVFVWSAENRAKIHINSLGLRDRAITFVKPAGATRIALMGDSFVEALQVEQSDTFDDRAEEILRGMGQNVEVVNLAISGQIPLEQLVRLEEVGSKFDVDIVVVISRARDFTSGEMRQDTKWPGYVVGADGSLVRGETFKLSFARRNSENWKGKLLTGSLRYSNIVRMLNDKRTQSFFEILGLPRDSNPTVANECFPTELSKLHGLWVNHSPEEDWNATEKYFGEFSLQVEIIGARSVYALREIPIPAQGCETELILRHELVEAAESYVTARDIAFVDWDVALQNSEIIGNLGTRDITQLQGFGRKLGVGHYNFDGHSASAEVLIDSIRFALP